MAYLDRIKQVVRILKRVGFPEEQCPKCNGDCDQCDVCNDTGVFKQRILPDWSPPVLSEGEMMVAYLDVDYWSGIAIIDSDGDVVSELDFPFATNVCVHPARKGELN